MLTMQKPVVEERDQRPQRSVGNDAALFARFLDGDDSAFMELFDRHTHRLYLYCLKFVNDRQRAEDLVQDMWERVIKLRADGKTAPDNPIGLFIRIARNLCLNSIRDERNLSSLEDVPEWNHPSVTMREMSHNEELVVSALARLPMQQREVLILNAYSGYRFDEIAQMLGEPVGAIRTRAWRARAQLGRLISALIELDESNENNELYGDNERRNKEE